VLPHPAPELKVAFGFPSSPLLAFSNKATRKLCRAFEATVLQMDKNFRRKSWSGDPTFLTQYTFE
jgi:hypothetical protein